LKQGEARENQKLHIVAFVQQPPKITMIGLKEIEAAYHRIKDHVHLTPLLTSKTLEKMANLKAGPDANFQFVFKCENLQKTGAFKARGACNAILMAKEEALKAATAAASNVGRDVDDVAAAAAPVKMPGVVTHSSGNHGQALAWAASKEVGDLSCTIVVPKETPQVKCQAIRGYGADLHFCENSPTSRKETCDKIANGTGKLIIHPYDDPNIIAGQGTMIWEMFREQGCGDLDAILTTVSGGGMASGICLAAKNINPDVKVLLVTPKGKRLGECLRSKERLWSNPPQFLDTIAEGIKTQQVGHLTFPVLCRYAEKEVIEVSDEEMLAGIAFCAERMKVVIEASAGAVIAALMFHSHTIKRNWPNVNKIGVILCGGNTDIFSVMKSST